MEPRRLVVLAGGVGSRLRARGAPKPLVRIAGLSLVERAIAAAKVAGFEEVIVVAGHRARDIDRHVIDVSRRRRMPVRVVHNSRYREGNGLSALAARDATGPEPFALVMADHVFALPLLRRLRRVDVAPGEVVVAVDERLGAAAGVDRADAMKVRVSGRHVTAIGKDLGTYHAFDVGAFVCTPALFDAVEIAERHGDTSLAGAVRHLAELGSASVLPVEEDEWWFDVDTRRDLRRGSRFLLRSTGKPLDGAVAARLNRIVSQRVITPLLLSLFPTISPNQVTGLALAAALAAAASFAVGWPVAAALLITLASILDGCDGEVARLTHRGSRFGAFFDAVLDRVSDGLVMAAAGVYLATSPDLLRPLGQHQIGVAVGASGSAVVAHLLVSYTTAKASVDLGHSYHGRLLGGGKGRDLRLLILTVGGAGAAVHSGVLVVALGFIAILCGGIVVVRLRASAWAAGAGSSYIGARAVAFDFDGTVADSMPLLTDLAVELMHDGLRMDRGEALRRYSETVGADFRSQLEEIAGSDSDQDLLDDVAERFERAKPEVMSRCRPFADAVDAAARLRHLGFPTLLCSSTRVDLVRRFCSGHDLLDGFTTVDGWSPARSKIAQIEEWCRALGLEPDEVLFVGDARRDAELASAAGVRFVGVVRPGGPDLVGGGGVPVVASLTAVSAALARAHRSVVRLSAGAPGPGLVPAPRPGAPATAVPGRSPTSAL